MFLKENKQLGFRAVRNFLSLIFRLICEGKLSSSL